MSEMIKRVADAIADLPNGIMDVEQVARTAIEAMREPTEAMLDAVSHYVDGGGEQYPIRVGSDDSQAIWRAMIDAALAEVSEAR
jgi:hypothetical protein